VTSIGEKGRQIAIKASSIDSGGSEEVFSHGNYGPFCMDIPGMFAHFDDLPDWDALRTKATDLNELLKHLVYQTELDLYPDDGDDTYQGRVSFDGIGTIAGEMNNWIGASADSFADTVEVPAKRIVPNQFWAARSLMLALEAEASLWETVHSDVHSIADEALNALEHVEEKGPLGLEFAIGVLGSIVAVAGALSAPATGGATLALALTVYGAVSSTVSGGKDLVEGWKIEGDSAPEITDAVRKAVTKLAGRAKEAEQKIADGLNDIAANIDNGVFHFTRPGLVNNPDFTGHE